MKDKRKVFNDAMDFLTADAPEGGVSMVSVDAITPFRDHPFKLYQGDRLNDMVESIKEHGILTPVIVEQYVDLGTHGMFICSVTEARVVSDQETMSYTYYQKNVKPKPETEGKKGFVCKVCGYIYEGDELPEDYICPLCKHGAVDFEPIG